MCRALAFRVAPTRGESVYRRQLVFLIRYPSIRRMSAVLSIDRMGQSRNLRLPRAPVHESLPAVTTSIWFWITFHIGVFVAIGIDLFTFHQRGRELSMTAAARRSVLWVAVCLAFNALVWLFKGPHHGLDFFTAYLVEYSLSADNIFVFV